MSRWRPDPLPLLLPDDLPMVEGVAELASRVRALALPRGRRVKCIVPAPFVRYVLVPWNARMQGRRARQVFAEHWFCEAYGELARDWLVRVDASRYGAAALACAMNAELPGVLAQLAQECGLVLESVEPALVHAFNAMPEPPRAGADWIVVPGSGTLTLLLVEDGLPLRVALAAGSTDRLDAVLRREWFALGRTDTWSRVHVCALPALPQAVAA